MGSIGDRMDGNYQPPILVEPKGGPIPTPGDDGDEVLAAAADPDAQRIQQQWDAAKTRLLRRWPKLAGPMVDELADQAEAAVTAGDLARLGDLQVSAGVIAAIAVPLRKTGTDLAAEAAAGVVEEAAAQATDITAPDAPARDRVMQHADAVARIIATGYAQGASRLSLQLSGAPPEDVRDEVARHLTELGESVNGLVGAEIGSLLSAAQHAGRLAVMEQHPATSYEAVEVNDTRKCTRCSEVAGRQYARLRDALTDYPVSGFRHCEGMGRCRGHIRPSWSDEGVPVGDTVMAHLPGRHDQGRHGNRFRTPGDRSSGIRQLGKERPSRKKPTGEKVSQSSSADSARQRQQDFDRWKALTAKPGVRFEGGTTRRKRRIADLQAEADQAAARRDALVAEETAKLKRKRMSAEHKADLVKQATAQADLDVENALSLVESIRNMPDDPGYFDKVIDAKPVLVQQNDQNHPLAVYGDLLHIEDESEVAHRHLVELDTVPAAWHAAFATYAANAPTGRPGGVFIGDKGVPDLDDMGHLRDEQPRGWPPGSTWSQVPGAADPSGRKVMLGGGGHGHGSTSLALHEFGHGADTAMGELLGVGSASAAPAWRALHTRLVQVDAVAPYFKQSGDAGPEEAWAEAFAGWSKGSEEGQGRSGQVSGLVKALSVDQGLAEDIASYFDQLQQQVEQQLAA